MFDYSKMPNNNIICVDMKSFYASCECVLRDLDPLTTHLAVVGSLKHKGSVVLASTPLMKQDFKIKTGSRRYEVPQDNRIILVEPQMRTYLRISHEISRLFNRYAPKKDIYLYSVDEAFINLNGTERLFGPVEDVAQHLRNEILHELGLTCCIGIGPNMLLAKVCLDVEAKQTGIAKWDYHDVANKLWTISPLSNMWGIGSRTEKHLNEMGIYTVGDLANYDLIKLEKKFGIMGNQLYYHAWGLDFSVIGESIQPRSHSIGKGQTLMRDYADLQEIKILVLEMCEDIAKKARSQHVIGRTISIGFRYSKNTGLKGFNRAKTIDFPTNITMEIYSACLAIIEKHYVEGMPIRQIHIRLGNVEKDTGVIQLDFFDSKKYKKKDIGFAMDEIRDKYGSDALLRAVSATKGATAKQRGSLIGGHKG